MKAAILDHPGAPDAFRLVNIPVPDCRPGEVLIEVMACGVGSRDVAERNGTYHRHVAFPLVIGLEMSGFVREVGAQVTSVKAGDYVATKAFSSCGMCRYCRTGRETSCLQRQPVRGGYAEFAALPEDAVVKIPASIPFEAACSLGPATGVALNAVRDVARVAIGETVLVTGASGGLGIPSMQLAKVAGARVLALTRRGDRSATLRAAGADDVVVMDGNGKFANLVLELTDGYGVDVVIDNVGSAVFWECFQSLGLHGRYAAVGQLFGERVEINLARIFFKRAQILGVGSVSRAQLADAATLMAQGKLTAHIDRVLPLEDVSLAHELVESGTAAGRVVLMADPTRAKR